MTTALTSRTRQLIGRTRQLLAKAPGGPWWWAGNIDHREDVYLAARVPGVGVTSVLSAIPEEMSEADWGRLWDEDSDLQDCVDRDAYIDYQMTGEPRRHIAFLDSPESLMMERGRDRAVFEVARNQNLPDDTPRTHPKVYRADVVAVRNPIADLLTLTPQLAAEAVRLHDGVQTLADRLAPYAAGTPEAAADPEIVDWYDTLCSLLDPNEEGAS